MVDASPRYAALTERAYTYLLEHDGIADADRLAEVLLGSGTRPGFWSTLLPTVLRDDRFVQLPDGRWALAGWEAQHTPSELLTRPYLVVDTETTGLSPQRERIIEIAVLRLEGDQVTSRFSSLVNPQRRISSFITRYTGITNVMVQDEPCFADLVPELVRFIRASCPIPVFVGHNILFDAGFMRAEFERAGEPWLAALLLDTMRLGIRLLPGLRKPSLDRLATALDIPVMNRHRADGDANLTARAFVLLLKKAQASGITTLEQLSELGAVGRNRAERPSTVGAPRARLVARPLPAELPERPGVYIMKDAQGQVIYVGKARNLRRRVRSYYTQALGYNRRMDGLMESLHEVDLCVTGSELEALLLESRMIRQHRPRYNVQGRNWEDYLFIKLTLPRERKKSQEPAPNWPRVSATRHADGMHCFGPFRNSQAVRVMIEVLGLLFPVHVRQYARSAESILAPLLVQNAPGDPQETMIAIRRFLEGDADGLLDRLYQEISIASKQQQYERAKRFSTMIKQIERVLRGQRLISDTLNAGLQVIVQPSAEENCAEVLVVLGGLPLGQVRIRGDANTEQIIHAVRPLVEQAPAERPTSVAQDQLDELSIVARWLYANRETGPVLPLPPIGADAIDWEPFAGCLHGLVAQQSQAVRNATPDENDTERDEETGQEDEFDF